MNDLWPHQVTALEMLRASLASGRRRPLLAIPTGGGKTRIAAEIVKGALAKGNKVVFTVPALSLVDQTVEAFHREGIDDIGVIQADHWLTDWSKPVQVASVQTLARRGFPDGTLAIIDEAHRVFETHGKWITDAAWRDKVFIGLSATPGTRGLGRLYDDLLMPTSTQELIDAGHLSPFKVYAPSHPDLRGVKLVAGDYHEGQLSTAMKPLVADIVDTWLKQARWMPTLLYGVDRTHAKMLEEQFKAAGVDTGYIDAFTEAREREQIKRKFHSGEVSVVCSVGCLTTGIDWDVRCLVLARPTKSKMLFVQIVGRGLRTAPGKEHCLILDHSDNHLRLGFVTDIHFDELDDGSQRQKPEPLERVALPSECGSCGFLKPPRVGLCPACGFKAERKSTIECEDGELTELRPAISRAPEVNPAKFYGELAWYANQRGYNAGWVAHKFKAKTGTWPDGPTRAAMYRAPSPETLSWIKSQNIRFAKSRERAA
jgi:DNA repair protein RadD